MSTSKDSFLQDRSPEAKLEKKSNPEGIYSSHKQSSEDKMSSMVNTEASLKQTSGQKNKLAGNFLSSWLQKSEGPTLQKMFEKKPESQESSKQKAKKILEEEPEESEKGSTKAPPTAQKQATVSESSLEEVKEAEEKEEESKTDYKPHIDYLSNFAYNKETPKSKKPIVSEEEEEEEDERLKKEREQFQSLIQSSQTKEKPRSRKKIIKDEYEEDEGAEDESEGQSYAEDDYEPDSRVQQPKFQVEDLFEEQDGEHDFMRKYKTMKRDECFKGSLWKYGAEDDAYFLPGHGFGLTKDKYDKLFDHQKEGVQWLYGLYRNKLGGVLADDMGLGKTVQISSFLEALYDNEEIKRALIVVPLTLKAYWAKELEKWCPSAPQIVPLSEKREEREKQVRSVKKHYGIVIATIGHISSDMLNVSESPYDMVVIDEGHKAKNDETFFSKKLKQLTIKRMRVILTGTPIQNNLNELWTVFETVQKGILGKKENFEYYYAGPIQAGLLNEATPKERERSEMLSQKIRSMYEAHILRRTKEQILKQVSAETLGRPLTQRELPLKTDLVVWLPLSQEQKNLENLVLMNDAIKDLRMESGGVLAFSLLNMLKKMYLHPCLLTKQYSESKRMLDLLYGNNNFEEDEEEEVSEKMTRGKRQKQLEQPKPVKKERSPKQKSENQLALFKTISELERMVEGKEFYDLIAYSQKMTFLFFLMKNLKRDGHKLLIFSMSKMILNLLESMLNVFNESKEGKKYNLSFTRIDGDTKPELREEIQQNFNTDPELFACLLTTKVGGFGLNLVGADRAIILDPDWNPANDNQAVDRIYRIGQKRDCIVYRLVTKGGFEEVVYKRQVYKKGLNLKTVETSTDSTSSADFQKYFSNEELMRILDLKEDQDYDRPCETMEMINRKNGFEFIDTPTNKQHIEEFLMKKCVGRGLIDGLSINTRLYKSKSE